jgi:hypothetical protein
VSDDLDPAAAKVADSITPEPATTPQVLQLEDAGMMFFTQMWFLCPSYEPCIPFTYAFRFRANFSGQDSSHFEHQGSGRKTPQVEVDPSASRTSLASVLGEPSMKQCLPLHFWCFNLVPSSCWLCEGVRAKNMTANFFADFERTLEDLSANDLMKIVRAYLSRGIVACQKGFERAAAEARTSLDRQKFLEDENRHLKEENEKLKRESRLQADQRAKQQEALNALKKELELSLKCYEECRKELKDMVMQYDAQNILLEANANLIAELKKVKGELEDTLEKNEAYCHQWGAYLATEYRRALESIGAEAQDFKITDNISSFVEWLHSELKLLPDTMSKLGIMGRQLVRKCCFIFSSDRVATISRLSGVEASHFVHLTRCQPQAKW